MPPWRHFIHYVLLPNFIHYVLLKPLDSDSPTSLRSHTYTLICIKAYLYAILQISMHSLFSKIGSDGSYSHLPGSDRPELRNSALYLRCLTMGTC